MTDPHEEMRAARVIEQFLEDETVQGAFNALRSQIDSAWAACTNPVEREALWHKRRALAEVENQLRVVVERGVVANVTLQREQRAAGRPAR